MKHQKNTLCGLMAAAALLCALSISANAADCSFSTDAGTGYYQSTAYEEVYGFQYNYGGTNVPDLQDVPLPYGKVSPARTGVMEKPAVVGQQILTAPVATQGAGLESIHVSQAAPAEVPRCAYTSVEGMKRSDGSIGTISIPSLNLTRKVWEGETTASMAKGVGHYSSTSGWDGNVGVCGHNRGSTYVIGAIKDLQVGDIITYTTVYGTRSYKVAFVKTISNNDWSYLQATADNRITLTTCLANHPESRICVQAVEG